MSAASAILGAHMIRERCGHLFDAALAGSLEHFEVRLDRLPALVERVVALARARFPDLRVPYHSRWEHFRAGGVDRVVDLDRAIAGLAPPEQARARFDLVVTSALLDAGAGRRWGQDERGRPFSRSEGLAVASLHLFLQGSFSSAPAQPLRTDARGLRAFEATLLSDGFHASAAEQNGGTEARGGLMQRLGDALGARPDLFGAPEPRIGGLYDALRARADGERLPARVILDVVLDGLGPIWARASELDGALTGDVWSHPAAGGEPPTRHLVPLQRLGLWIAFSLLEPLERAGVEIVDADDLCGLADHRFGGLFLDAGVLVAKHREVIDRPHGASTEIVVEWRALTVALLDRLAQLVREALGLDARRLPVVRVLEGASVAAEQLAVERRQEAGPSVRVEGGGILI